MADFTPNLDDGEVWLPSDIFHNEVVPASSLRNRNYSCMDDMNERFAAFTLLQHRRNVSKPPPNLLPNLEVLTPFPSYLLSFFLCVVGPPCMAISHSLVNFCSGSDQRFESTDRLVVSHSNIWASTVVLKIMLPIYTGMEPGPTFPETNCCTSISPSNRLSLRWMERSKIRTGFENPFLQLLLFQRAFAFFSFNKWIFRE